MAEVLVYLDHADGAVRKPTLELLTLARHTGEPVAVEPGGGVAGTAATLAEHGAVKVLTPEATEYADYLVVPKVDALQAAHEAVFPAAVLVPSSAEGKEIAARLALRPGSGIITDAVDLKAGGSGRWPRSRCSPRPSPPVPCLQGHQGHRGQPQQHRRRGRPGCGHRRGRVRGLLRAATSAKVTGRTPRESTGCPELTEAAIVVSGGRGVNGALRDHRGARRLARRGVGASRAAVDAGWFPRTSQARQTGQSVSPQTYIASGISGAIQHRAGMQISKTIVPINKDDEAPVCDLVGYGVVGGLFDVVSALTQEIKTRKG
ncbi:electron transfer flavoprotein subunit alpha/FixB family protein [Streptomyces sp. NPDC014995]|uniref:electron transfer flavoprotein subunit alpha/FixB family protein n=1 Tax=Streptomyces sp. NPDC014995 TaxID=3364936 RepID=UPI0036F81566